MEEFIIIITAHDRSFNYRVIDKHTDNCKFEVYQGQALMAIYEPDEHEYIHICQNPGGLDEEIIVQIADRIEAHYL